MRASVFATIVLPSGSARITGAMLQLNAMRRST
jgi:hypothetical protein